MNDPMTCCDGYCLDSFRGACRRVAALEAELAKLRETIGYLADEVKSARAHRETKGGQQVPFHGDFASAPPSVLNRLDPQRAISAALPREQIC